MEKKLLIITNYHEKSVEEIIKEKGLDSSDFEIIRLTINRNTSDYSPGSKENPFFISDEFTSITVFANESLYLKGSNKTIHRYPIGNEFRDLFNIEGKNNIVYVAGNELRVCFHGGNQNELHSEVDNVKIYNTQNNKFTGFIDIVSLWENSSKNEFSDVRFVTFWETSSLNTFESVTYETVLTADSHDNEFGSSGRVKIEDNSNNNTFGLVENTALIRGEAFSNDLTFSEDENYCLIHEKATDNTIYDEGGDDVFFVGQKAKGNSIHAGPGNDVIISSGSYNNGFGEEGDDTIFSAVFPSEKSETIRIRNIGGEGNDYLFCYQPDSLYLEGSIRLCGDDGDDHLIPYLSKEALAQAAYVQDEEDIYAFIIESEIYTTIEAPYKNHVVEFDANLMRNFEDSRNVTNNKTDKNIYIRLFPGKGNDTIYLSSQMTKLNRKVVIKHLSSDDTLLFDDKDMQSTFEKTLQDAISNKQQSCSFAYDKNNYEISLLYKESIDFDLKTGTYSEQSLSKHLFNTFAKANEIIQTVDLR